MDFTPFKAPPSDHHPMNTGLSTENGVTAKGLIEGINAHLTNIYQVMKGEVAHIVDTVDEEARSHVTQLENAVTALQQQVEALVTSHASVAATVIAMSTPAEPQPPVKVDPTVITPLPGTTEHDQLTAALAEIERLKAETTASTGAKT